MSVDVVEQHVEWHIPVYVRGHSTLSALIKLARGSYTLSVAEELVKHGVTETLRNYPTRVGDQTRGQTDQTVRTVIRVFKA